MSLFFSRKFERWLGINTPFYEKTASASYKIHFVDVGQGDCTIFEFPNGDIMIVDSGKAKSENALKDYLDKVIFADRDNKEITYLIATHSDEDHVGNMKYILDNYVVKNVYRPVILSKSEAADSAKTTCDTNVYDQFIKAANAEQESGEGVVRYVQNASGELLANYGFWIYGPMKTKYSDVNDFCPFIFVEANGIVTLITGDASAGVEDEIIVANYDAFIEDKIDLYQCGHHGSSTSTGDVLLSRFDIDTCIISSGKNNSYGHPHAETIKKLHDNNIEFLNTADVGSIIYAYDENGNEIVVATGNIKVFDSVRWWMVVLVFDALAAIVIFSIKIKVKKRL